LSSTREQNERLDLNAVKSASSDAYEVLLDLFLRRRRMLISHRAVYRLGISFPLSIS
jgi:ABC-type transporter lipoprotein component MlaA